MAALGPDLRSDDLEAEIERLHVSIDRLSEVVAGLKEDGKQQAARTQSLAEKQAADFRSLLTMLHDNYAKLLDRHDGAFKGFADRFDKLVDRQDTDSKSSADRFDKLVERQDAASKGFADRFDKLVDRQDAAFKSFADRLDKLVDRQDSHFRWLAGLVVASALSVGIAVIKLH